MLRSVVYSSLTALLFVGWWAARDATSGRSPSVDQTGPANPNPFPVTRAVKDGRTSIETFLCLTRCDRAEGIEVLGWIDEHWSPGDELLLVEVAPFVSTRPLRGPLIETLERLTGQEFGFDLDRWNRWIWVRGLTPRSDYVSFKRKLYQTIDPKFSDYFTVDRPSLIRLDQVQWGGVKQDGIPPLDHPEVISVDEATYLDDSNIVFGIELGGQARAYPKRILAHHEMVKDTVGKLSINGVYCTLCGSMIVYETDLDGKHYELGTSGFLYRSNKLMFDHETQSLWSTLKGRPVIGPLVDAKIQLKPRHVVTTTWGQWRQKHPDTEVLSLPTGFSRSYGEGVAYLDYFSHDDLMFPVPTTDHRLKNKDEVFIIRGDPSDPVAIAVSFLQRTPIHHETIGGKRYVVLTDSSGACRAYQAADLAIERWVNDHTVESSDGRQWQVNESELVSMDSPSEDESIRLPRVSAHRAFWFGWHAAFPETRLVK